MKVTMKMDKRVLGKLAEAQIIALKKTTAQLRTEIIQSGFIPFDEGTLQNISTDVDYRDIRKGKASVVHNMIYATRLYFNPQYNFDTTTNSRARGLWWDDWLTGSKKNRPINLYKQFYKRSSGV